MACVTPNPNVVTGPIIGASRSIPVSFVVGESPARAVIDVAFSVGETASQAITITATVGGGVEFLPVSFVAGEIQASASVSVSFSVDNTAAIPVSFVVGDLINVFNPATNRYELDLAGMSLSGLGIDNTLDITRASVTASIQAVNDGAFGEFINVAVTSSVDDSPATWAEVVVYYAGTEVIADTKDVDDVTAIASMHLAAGLYDIIIQPKLGFTSKWRPQAVLNYTVARGLTMNAGVGAIVEEHAVRSFANVLLPDVLVRAYDQNDALIGVATSDVGGVWRINVDSAPTTVTYILTRTGVFPRMVKIAYD